MSILRSPKIRSIKIEHEESCYVLTIEWIGNIWGVLKITDIEAEYPRIIWIKIMGLIKQMEQYYKDMSIWN